ncbi:hypothetical protein ACT4XD_00030 [Acinetobacter baumannii]
MKKLLTACLFSLGLVGCATTSGTAPRFQRVVLMGQKEFQLMDMVLHVIKWFVH